jgi:glycerol-3-phosphate dehydrogenase
MPIIEAVYKVLYEQAKPKEVIKDLMERSLKSEE